MNRFILKGVLVIGIAFLLIKCSSATKSVKLDVDQPAYEKLSDYHFFIGVSNQLEPNVGVLPYDLITPLFTDYAEKSRFVWLPDGTTAAYDEKEALNFPVGAVLIKNFYYNHDASDLSKGRRIIETRLLVKRKDKWDAITYVWNDEQTEAYLEVAGGITKVDWINKKGVTQSVNYVIPNKNQCKGCHEYKGELVPIGPKIRNLNMAFSYADGPENQLKKWAVVGYLSGYDESKEHPKVATWNDEASGSLRDRAMSYLEINCGHCHRKGGPGGVSGLNLMIDEENPLNMGICKAPVSAGKGSGGNTYDIVPGEPGKSILVYRMITDDPGARMPEIGRSLVHEEGVQLIVDWISSMEGGCPESIDAK